MSFNLFKPVRHTTDPDLLGGPNGLTDNFILQSGGGSDKIIMTGNRDSLLQSGTTDKILLSGGGSNEILLSGNFIKRTN